MESPTILKLDSYLTYSTFLKHLLRFNIDHGVCIRKGENETAIQNTGQKNTCMTQTCTKKHNNTIYCWSLYSRLFSLGHRWINIFCAQFECCTCKYVGFLVNEEKLKSPFTFFMQMLDKKVDTPCIPYMYSVIYKSYMHRWRSVIVKMGTLTNLTSFDRGLIARAGLIDASLCHYLTYFSHEALRLG